MPKMEVSLRESVSLRVLALEGADLLAAEAGCSVGPIVRFTVANAVAVSGPATADARLGGAHEAGVEAPAPPRVFSWAPKGDAVELALEPVTLADTLRVQCLVQPAASAAGDFDGCSDQNGPSSKDPDAAAVQRV